MIATIFNNKLVTTLGVVLGFGAGYLYWEFYGCTESCSITSVWWRSALYGSAIGGLMFSAIQDFVKNGKF